MTITTHNSKILEQLKIIADESKDSLRKAVAQEALERASDYEHIQMFFSDLVKSGCVSGMISSLIYFSNTHTFFDKYYDEIEELRQDYQDNTGEPVNIQDDLKNTLAWFGFEETTWRLADELDLEL